MIKSIYNEHTQSSIQIENHETAAWANIKTIKPISNVTIPSELDVKDAKEWVDTNQK